MRFTKLPVVVALAFFVVLVMAGISYGQIVQTPQTPQLDPVQMEIAKQVSNDKSINVVPFEVDPFDMNLSQSSWLTGIGCAANGGTDLCAPGDPKDKRNEGLLLAKTGLTSNFVSAGARINGVKGMLLTELGYDLRKPADTADPRGSHCGAGAPRFNVVIAGENFFVGCNSPTPVTTPFGLGWIRLRWMGPIILGFGPRGFENIAGKQIEGISLLFDEGQDVAPDNFGVAILDNIDVNSQLAGRGPHGGH